MPGNCQTDDKNQNEYQDSGKDIRCREEGGELLQEHGELLVMPVPARDLEMTTSNHTAHGGITITVCLLKLATPNFELTMSKFRCVTRLNGLKCIQIAASMKWSTSNSIDSHD